MRLPRFLIVLPVLFASAACDGGTDFRIDPVLFSDTVTLAAPIAGNDTLPAALDISVQGNLIGGGRFPERPADAAQADFFVRLRDGQLVLVPAGALGLSSRAAITRALPVESFEALDRVGTSGLLTDTAVVLQQGAVYAARSRDIGNPLAGSCVQFSKLQPLEVDVATGRVQIRLVSNRRCGDPRLVEED